MEGSTMLPREAIRKRLEEFIVVNPECDVCPFCGVYSGLYVFKHFSEVGQLGKDLSESAYCVQESRTHTY